MSEPVSAYAGAYFEGIATIEERGLRGMITLRGDLASTALKEAVKSVAGPVPGIVSGIVPGQREIVLSGDNGVAWMSPDELLVLVPYAEAEAAAAALEAPDRMAVNLSDARAVFRVSGPQARAVLAKLSPVDLSPAAFKPGMIRRTRLAQVPAAFWMVGEDAFELVCFRSVAGYVFDLLCTAAARGSEVRVF